MGKHVVYGLAGLVIGLAIGFVGANSINRGSTATTQTSQVEVPAAAHSNTAALSDVSAVLQQAEAEPQNFAIQMRTGDMYAQIRRPEKAIEFYSRGVAIKPEDFNANVVLANAYFDSGQFENAADYYSKALAINPNDVNARTDLGTTFVERKDPDYDRGIKEFTSALELAPDHAPALYYLGVAYGRKGNTAEAQKTLSRLEKSNPNSDLVERLKQHLAAN